MAATQQRQYHMSRDMHSGEGLRSFWKKGSKDEQQTPQEVTSIEQESAGKHRAGTLRRFLTSTSSASSEGNNSGGGSGNGNEGSQSEAQKRRQQVYQAQKRHRNRKAEYVQTLEAEVARLRHLDSEVNSEKDALESQNKTMKDFLASQSLDAHLGSMDLTAPSQDADAFAGTVDLRYDEQLEQERWFIDLMADAEMEWTSSDASAAESGGEQASAAAAKTPVAGDSWAALDFILALEYPCRDHVHHPAINPDAWRPQPGNGHGHTMTATAAVFASARPLSPDAAGAQCAGPIQHTSSPKGGEKWQLPHTEIDKLIGLSEGLDLDDDQFTPAQIYSAVRESVPNEAFLRPTLEFLKQPLAKLVHCAHFGSTLEAELFWQHFQGAVESLKFTRPELGG